MPLKTEVDYWHEVSTKFVDGNNLLKENLWKRWEQFPRLMKYDWMDKRVLEIGVGTGAVAGMLQLALMGNWEYIGTELGKGFRDFAKNVYHLKVIEADVRELPDGPFDRIIALDSLEHVRPEHREIGYKRIAQIAAPGCLLFIHLSRSQSLHDPEFDHPFGLQDLSSLESVGFVLNSYERYPCLVQGKNLDYAFVVMQK